MYRHPSSSGSISLIAGYGEDGLPEWVDILHADPRILFSGRFLRDIADGACYKTVPLAACDRAETGGVFRIYGRNRTLVYLITEADPLLPCPGGTASCPPGCSGHRIPDTFAGQFPD
jgi:hypothetical protein